jgi:hypothetical protein
MRVIWTFFFLGLAACDEAPVPASLKETPAKYVGTWDVSLEDCKAGRGYTTVIVAADEVLFSDSHLAVTGASPDGANAVRVDGHFKTEVAEWDGAIRLELAEGGKVLHVVNGSTLVPRIKCS